MSKESFNNIVDTVSGIKAELLHYKLLKPVNNIDGNIVESVTLKDDLTGADIERIANAGDKEGTWMIALVATVSGLPMAVVRSMSFKDVKGISTIAKSFLEDGESTTDK